MRNQSLYSFGSKAVQHRQSAHACHGHTLRPLSKRRPSVRQRNRSSIRHTRQARLGEDERHVVSAPRYVVGGKDHLASVLLMLLPGAYMQCQAYDGLINRLKVEAIPHAILHRIMKHTVTSVNHRASPCRMTWKAECSFGWQSHIPCGRRLMSKHQMSWNKQQRASPPA